MESISQFGGEPSKIRLLKYVTNLQYSLKTPFNIGRGANPFLAQIDYS